MNVMDSAIIEFFFPPLYFCIAFIDLSTPTAPTTLIQHLFSTHSTCDTCSAPTAPVTPVQHLAVKLGVGMLHLPPCEIYI